MNHWTAPRRVDIDPWAVTRFSDTTEAWELCAMQRQAADERAASQKWHASQPQHGTECCADTGDESKTERAPGWQIALIYGMSALASLSAGYAVWPYIAGLL